MLCYPLVPIFYMAFPQTAVLKMSAPDLLPHSEWVQLLWLGKLHCLQQAKTLVPVVALKLHRTMCSVFALHGNDL